MERTQQGIELEKVFSAKKLRKETEQAKAGVAEAEVGFDW